MDGNIYTSIYILSFSAEILGRANLFSVFFRMESVQYTFLLPLTVFTLHSTSLKAMSITFVGTDWIAGILPKNKF